MKIILSRKGFDSAYGKVPNPILPDGRLIPLPIPQPMRLMSRKQGHRYADLSYHGVRLGPLMEQLTLGRIRAGDPCHLDPDLHRGATSRPPRWRPAFGQIDAAQGHLAKSGVGRGDLFLFFGWFQEIEETAGKWRYVKTSPSRHVIYGWMRVDQVISLADRKAQGEILLPHSQHPHVMYEGTDGANALYLAAKRLNGSALPGAGVFNGVTQRRTLTDLEQAKRSVWTLPAWFHPDHGTTVSYHQKPSRWKMNGNQCTLRSVGRGQEFVVVPGDEKQAESWLAELFKD